MCTLIVGEPTCADMPNYYLYVYLSKVKNGGGAEHNSTVFGLVNDQLIRKELFTLQMHPELFDTEKQLIQFF